MTSEAVMLKKLRHSSVRKKVTVAIILTVAVFALGYFSIHAIISGFAIPSVYGEGISWRVEYNEHGLISKRIDPSGRTTQYAYSFLSNNSLRTVTETPPEGAPVTWQLDANGKFEAMKDGEGEVAYRYDNRGKLVAVERKGSSPIHYIYDYASRLLEMKIGNFYRIVWTYDFLGRITKIETPAGNITYDYQTGQNTIVRSLPNGIKTFWKRQPNGELDEITHGFFRNPVDRQYSVLSRYSYTHSPDGRIAAISEYSSEHGQFTRQYAYDTMGRLVRATGAAGREYVYEYDQAGNCIKASTTGSPAKLSTYDWAGRLTSVVGKPVQYDACGNLISATLDGVARKYAYRPDGRLAKAKSDNESAEYRYDGNGRLIVRKSTSGETRFIPDPLSGIGHPLVIDEPDGVRTLVIWEGDTPLALVRNGKVEWLLHDHLGSVRIVTDTQGKVSHTCDYDPFGVPVNAERSASLMPRFAGLFIDDLAGGYLTMARTYAPNLGSFLQPDPQKRIPTIDSETLSFYSYSGSDPVNFVDFNGTERIPAEMRTAQLEVMDSIREQQAEMRDRQRDMLDRIREQQVDIHERQYEIMQQTQDVGMRQLRLAEKFRDDYFQLAPLVVGLQAIRLVRFYSPFLPGLGSTFVSGATAGLDEVVTNRISRTHLETGNLLQKSGKDIETALEWIGNTQIGLDIAKVIAPSTLHVILKKELIGEKWIAPRTYIEPSGQLSSIAPLYKNSIVNMDLKLDWQELIRIGVRNKRDEVIENGIKYSVSKIGGSGQTGKENGGLVARGGSWGDRRDGLSISPVGGVYLGGSGRMLDGMGELKGVRTDTNGNLVLVGEENGNIKLPPLRLDDVVTIFRSVYLNGEGPTVTIDPNPANPHASPMVIRHSKATEDTYVGWVLYEADRLMKGYGQGVDNITRKGIASRVPGYANVLETTYFGGANPHEAQNMGIWERFWIVPAESRRYEGSRKELTLFDVPLKVKTQKMRWQNGKLVDDQEGKSSPGAQAFTSWFTTNYDAIGGEQFLTPPKESKMTKPVPVFTELRRIALLTAVAEKLRDQGVPMPFWMHDYDVRKVPFEHVTPAITVPRERSVGNIRHTSQIFGGVELSPESRAVKTYATSGDVVKAPADIRNEVDRSVKLAERLERAITDAAPVPLTVNRVSDGNREYKVVSIPGAETQALGPCQLGEVDLVIPIAGGSELQLSRSFNSFFCPKGELGQGWTMDLPRLQEVRIPGNRKGGKVSYAIGYELLTPLNSVHARFKDIRPVKDLPGSSLQVPDADGPFYGLAIGQPDFFKNAETHELFLKDGQEWHFTKLGDLVAIKDGAQVTVYERDANGRVSRIVGLLGRQLAGEIKLGYDEADKLIKATGNSFYNKYAKPVEVTYTYNTQGRLTGVTSNTGTLGYNYSNLQLSAVTWSSKAGNSKPDILRSFHYNSLGQMISEKIGNVTVDHTITHAADGMTATSQGNQASHLYSERI